MRPLTTEDIVRGLRTSGGVLLWSYDLGCAQRDLSAAITVWREATGRDNRVVVAHELVEAGLDHRTIHRVTGISVRTARAEQWPPAPTRAERADDARHIAQWGYV